MLQNETRRVKTSAHDSTDALEALDRPQTLGIDAQGCVHHYSPYDARVVVVDDEGTIQRTEDLADRRLATWVAYVDDKRGWADLRYAETFGDILREALR
jgi:hypothetical protein